MTTFCKPVINTLTSTKQKTKRGAQRPPERNIMILTETLSGKFLCVVNITPEKLIEQMKGEGGVACLQALLPNFDEIDPWEGFSVHLNTINGTIHEIEIYGDNGLIELTLIPNPIEWN